MKHVWAVGFAVISVLSGGCAVFRPTEVPFSYPAENYDVRSEYSELSRLNYLIALPEDYEESRQDYPLILFLHSMAERGDDPNLLIYNENGERSGLIRCMDEKDLPFIILSPLCPKRAYWSFLTENLNDLAGEIAAAYRVKENSIYLTGVSMGAMGVWSLAMDYPDRFAAIIPISGGVYSPPMKVRIGGLADIAVWGFHSREDGDIPLKKEEWFIDKLRERNFDVRYTIAEGDEHYLNDRVYADDEIYEWLLEHAKY